MMASPGPSDFLQASLERHLEGAPYLSFEFLEDTFWTRDLNRTEQRFLKQTYQELVFEPFVRDGATRFLLARILTLYAQ